MYHKKTVFFFTNCCLQGGKFISNILKSLSLPYPNITDYQITIKRSLNTAVCFLVWRKNKDESRQRDLLHAAHGIHNRANMECAVSPSNCHYPS